MTIEFCTKVNSVIIFCIDVYRKTENSCCVFDVLVYITKEEGEFLINFQRWPVHFQFIAMNIG